jgi:transcriptional regulator with XRE-family HTH domain
MKPEQVTELAEKEYRHGLVNAQIEVDLPFQIRALRKQLELTQPELAERAGMKQPRISAMEKPGGAHFTLETLRRLAKAFDVALIVRFAPFSELLDWSKRFSPDDFAVPTFDQELSSGSFDREEREHDAIVAGKLIPISAGSVHLTAITPRGPAPTLTQQSMRKPPRIEPVTPNNFLRQIYE